MLKQVVSSLAREIWSYIQNVGATEAIAPKPSVTWTVNFK
jgi:hypothetical protein